jgi:hypothetical protein
MCDSYTEQLAIPDNMAIFLNPTLDDIIDRIALNSVAKRVVVSEEKTWV